MNCIQAALCNFYGLLLPQRCARSFKEEEDEEEEEKEKMRRWRKSRFGLWLTSVYAFSSVF